MCSGLCGKSRGRDEIWREIDDVGGLDGANPRARAIGDAKIDARRNKLEAEMEAKRDEMDAKRDKMVARGAGWRPRGHTWNAKRVKYCKSEPKC